MVCSGEVEEVAVDVEGGGDVVRGDVVAADWFANALEEGEVHAAGYFVLLVVTHKFEKAGVLVAVEGKCSVCFPDIVSITMYLAAVKPKFHVGEYQRHHHAIGDSIAVRNG